MHPLLRKEVQRLLNPFLTGRLQVSAGWYNLVLSCKMKFFPLYLRVLTCWCDASLTPIDADFWGDAVFSSYIVSNAPSWGFYLSAERRVSWVEPIETSMVQKSIILTYDARYNTGGVEKHVSASVEILSFSTLTELSLLLLNNNHSRLCFTYSQEVRVLAPENRHLNLSQTYIANQIFIYAWLLRFHSGLIKNVKE